MFDLDPGPGAGLAECVDVALALRERLGPLGERVGPVTSGSKGLHLYVPMDDPITSSQASEWARLAAEELEKALPALVVSRMAKSLRAGKVLVDWSQNNRSKTTIAPYSLRGRELPTVAAPRTWAGTDRTRVAAPGLPGGARPARRGLDPLAILTDATNAPDTVAAGDGGAGRRPRSAPVVVGGRRHPSGSAAGLPVGLAGPVHLALAKAQDQVPGPRALPGGSRYELKFDGFRMAGGRPPGRCPVVVQVGGPISPPLPRDRRCGRRCRSRRHGA